VAQAYIYHEILLNRGNTHEKILEKIFGCGNYLFIHLPALFTNALLLSESLWKEGTNFFEIDIE
jgi:hypothetical protein